jgi:hypothetical protein
VAMAGLATYRRPNTPAGPNYREFIGVQLSTPLLIGQKYFLSFYTNFSFTLGIATNNIGMRFSTVANDSCCLPILNNFAHLYTDLILSDSVDWVKLSGSFIADSNYNFISIGNFFQDNQTDTLNVIVNPNPDAAYYFIDDVCVSTDSAYNQTWTSVAQFDPSDAVEVYPNPFTQNFYVKSNVFYSEIKIYDLTGREIYYIKYDLGNSVTQFDINNGPGLYIMKITTKDKTTIKYKLLKN